MRLSTSLSILAATASLAVAPAAASAAQVAAGATAPVAIVACATYAGTPVSSFNNTVGFANFGSYEVSFINRANVAATHVGLDVNADGSVQRIDENGSFAPATRIDKDSQPSYIGGFDGRRATCTIAEVDFADGSSWHAATSTAFGLPASANLARH